MCPGGGHCAAAQQRNQLIEDATLARCGQLLLLFHDRFHGRHVVVAAVHEFGALLRQRVGFLWVACGMGSFNLVGQFFQTVLNRRRCGGCRGCTDGGDTLPTAAAKRWFACGGGGRQRRRCYGVTSLIAVTSLLHLRLGHIQVIAALVLAGFAEGGAVVVKSYAGTYFCT